MGYNDIYPKNKHSEGKMSGKQGMGSDIGGLRTND